MQNLILAVQPNHNLWQTITLKCKKQGIDVGKKTAELEFLSSHNTDNNEGKNEKHLSNVGINDDNLFCEDGQPDINSIMNHLTYEERKKKKL